MLSHVVQIAFFFFNVISLFFFLPINIVCPLVHLHPGNGMQKRTRQGNYKTADPVYEFNFACILFLALTVVIFTPDAQKMNCPFVTSCQLLLDLLLTFLS